MEIHFGLLGSLSVRRDGGLVAVPAGGQRALLAALLLSANRVVPTETLIETLWGEAPPVSARVSLQNYVKRLRQLLADGAHTRIVTQPRGYLIRVGAGELDVEVFGNRLAATREAAGRGDWGEAADLGRAALALWRDRPLVDTASELLVRQEVPRLDELRLQALEMRMRADLHCGQAGEVITELGPLLAANPLRERLYELLMLALHGDGRQAEALAAFRRARTVLVEELGAEPGRAMRRVHEQILADDPELAVPELAVPDPAAPDPAGRDAVGREAAAGPGHGGPGAVGRKVAGGPQHRGPGAAGPVAPQMVVPRQLPGPVRGFVGRAAEAAELTRLLTAQAPIVVIDGTAGVGKTALALHWAHRHATAYPDGQLYVDLRGYDPERPMHAPEALAGFLRALGTPGPDIPAEPDERAARYRSLLSGRRVLVLVDNARDPGDVRPLLPAGPACAAIVTSRSSLGGLVARDGAHRIDLDVLPDPDAVRLLTELVGARAEADPASTGALAAQCSRLPLALRLVAERVAGDPATPLPDLVRELADERHRLEVLDASGDDRTAVRDVFSWSYRQLEPGTARVFRLAGLHPGTELDAYAAAALAGEPVGTARAALDRLARAHLVHRVRPDRYGLHDLLRAYAAGLAEGDEAAVGRLADHYLAAAALAMDTLLPSEKHRRPEVPPDPADGPLLSDVDSARAWLTAELANLVAIAEHTAENGMPRHTTRLAAILFRFLERGGLLPEATVVHGAALRAARRLGDPAAEATALVDLGVVDIWQGRRLAARRLFEQAVALCGEETDPQVQARAVHNLGMTYMQEPRSDAAARHLERALELCRRTGDRTAEANTLINLGIVSMWRGGHEAADAHFARALALSGQTGDRVVEANALINVGDLRLRQQRAGEAGAYLRPAIAICREIADPHDEAYGLIYLGLAERRTDLLDDALTLTRRYGDRPGEAEALNSLGDVHLAAGRADAAYDRYAAALELATEIDDRSEQERARAGLARVCESMPARAVDVPGVG
ncbi:MAG TPA: BTAD domain-containing putative transcriptional regulator [Mycobacteriales bacterium]|nr:BTAD domain-containing putative transcriptional regulator [Mycobacteriales bacterium]